MTKRHFESFAREIKEYGEGKLACVPYREVMTRMVIKIASQDNSRFDSARFLKACGL